jgi:hypothetical protein
MSLTSDANEEPAETCTPYTMAPAAGCHASTGETGTFEAPSAGEASAGAGGGVGFAAPVVNRQVADHGPAPAALTAASLQRYVVTGASAGSWRLVPVAIESSNARVLKSLRVDTSR